MKKGIKKIPVAFKFHPDTLRKLRRVRQVHGIPYGPLVEGAAADVADQMLKIKPIRAHQP